MTTAFFDSHGLDGRIDNELFDRAQRAPALPMTAVRGAGMALSALLPDLALVAGAAAAVGVALALALLPAGSWQPALLVTQALVLLALGLAGQSLRWMLAATINLLVTVVAGYGLMLGSVQVAELVLWQSVLAALAFTGAAGVPAWRQALGAQMVWWLVISLSL